jgi:hypothetical protein
LGFKRAAKPCKDPGDGFIDGLRSGFVKTACENAEIRQSGRDEQMLALSEFGSGERQQYHTDRGEERKRSGAERSVPPQ